MQPLGRGGRSSLPSRIFLVPEGSPRALARLAVVAVPALLSATLLVSMLQNLGVPNASPVYLLAVVATALGSGTIGALASAVAGILLYDFFFTEPFHTFTINDPDEWLSLVLLLFVGLVVGQLTALERARTRTATAREREARELFNVSRALATRASTPAVLPEIAELLRTASSMESLWIALGADDASERIAAESGGSRSATGGFHWTLRRTPGEQPAAWVRLHSPTAARSREPADGLQTYRVRIEAPGLILGSIWGRRARSQGIPDRSATRLLSATADQIGQALAQDRLAAEARAAEIARQSDDLKSALLQSVSHDIRTPLAAIRAAAGTLRPDSGLDRHGRQASADAIEREVEYLDRIVANLLDLSRIEAGALRAELDVFELDDLAGRTLSRFGSRLDGRDVQVELPPSLPVYVDPVFLDESLTNLLENALRFAGPGTPIRVQAVALPGGDQVRLVVEDGGPGVPDEALERLFEKFYRVPSERRQGAGTGIGLAVVRGLVEAMGGRVRARHGELGGLAIELDLPLAHLPAELVGAAPG
jgi:two-component system sensor histidine kinase KdpD